MTPKSPGPAQAKKPVSSQPEPVAVAGASQDVVALGPALQRLADPARGPAAADLLLLQGALGQRAIQRLLAERTAAQAQRQIVRPGGFNRLSQALAPAIQNQAASPISLGWMGGGKANRTAGRPPLARSAVLPAARKSNRLDGPAATQGVPAAQFDPAAQARQSAPISPAVSAKPLRRAPRDPEMAALGQLVSRYAITDPAAARALPIPTQITVMRELRGTIQRGGVAGAVGKGVLMAFVNAISGPLMHFKYLKGSHRDEWNKDWKRLETSYDSVHLERMAKAAKIIKEIGAFAGWVSLMSSISALIAAAFAPAGLAASAVLGSISAIAGLVAGAVGLISGGLSTVLAISTLRKALAIKNAKSIERRKLMLLFYRDLTGAISGLIAGAGSVVGLSIGAFQLTQSAGDVATNLAGGGLTAVGMDLAKGAGAGQAFAVADEVQNQIGNVKVEESDKKLKADPRYGANEMAKQAVKMRGQLVQTSRAQRNPGGQPVDYRPQVLQELGKLAGAGSEAVSSASADQQLIGGEQQASAAAGQDVASAASGLGDVAQVNGLQANLRQMDEQSAAGSGAVEAVGAAPPESAIASEGQAETRRDQLQAANQGLDQLESKSDESFGRRSTLGSIKAFFKRGLSSLKKWFVSGFGNLKERVKSMLARIKRKLADYLINASGLKEPLAAMQAQVGAAQAGEAAEQQATADTMEQAGASGNLGQQLIAAVQQSRESLQS